jgi:hypothetical protein
MKEVEKEKEKERGDVDFCITSPILTSTWYFAARVHDGRVFFPLFQSNSIVNQVFRYLLFPGQIEHLLS